MKTKTLLCIAGLTTLLVITVIICYKGIHIQHDMSGKQNVTIPPATHTIEIPRLNGKESLKFNIKSPEQKLIIEKN